MASSSPDWRKMSPWEGAHQLSASIKPSIRLAIWSGVLAWWMTMAHAAVYGYTFVNCNPVAFTFLNIPASTAGLRTKEASMSAFLAMFTRSSRVALTLDFFQMSTSLALLILPILTLPSTVHRNFVTGAARFVRLLTFTGLIVGVLRLSSLSQESGALLNACVQAQTQTSAVKAGLGGSLQSITTAANAACAVSLTWFKPVSVIASIVDLGAMLFFCLNIHTYERKLMADRYSSEASGGLVSCIRSTGSRHAGRGGVCAPLPLVDEHDEKND